MQNAIILRKNPNEAIPSDVISKVAEAYRGSWGAAFISDGQISMASETTSLDVEQFEAIQTELLDKHVMFFFSQAVDHQPYTLVEHNGEPVVVGFLEGQFKMLAKDGDVEHNETLIAQRWLGKKLQKAYAHLEGDVDKLTTELREVETEIDFHNMIEGRGVFELLTSNGDVISFSKGVEPLIEKWGWMSHKLGFGIETKVVEEPVKEEPKTALSAFKSAAKKVLPAVSKATLPPKTDTTPIPATPSPAPVAGEPEVKAEPVPGDALTKVKDAATQYCWWTPKKHSTTSQLKKHYKNICDGVLPNGWKNGPTVMVPVDTYNKYKGSLGGTVSYADPATLGPAPTTAKSFKEMGEVMKKALEPEVLVDPKVEEKTEIKVSSRKEGPNVSVPATKTVLQPEKKSDVEPKLVKPEMAKPVTTEALPVLSPDRRNAVLKGNLIHTLDKNSIKIDDPSVFLEGTKRVPTLMEQLGLENDAMLKWSFENMKKFAVENPDAMAIMWHDMRCAHIRLAQQVKHLMEEKEKVVEEQPPVKAVANGIGKFTKPGKVLRR